MIGITCDGCHRYRNFLPREEAALIEPAFMQVQHVDREGEDGANLYGETANGLSRVRLAW